MVSRRDLIALAGGSLALSTLSIAGVAQAQATPLISSTLKITQIRNATMRIDYAGGAFLDRPDAGC